MPKQVTGKQFIIAVLIFAVLISFGLLKGQTEVQDHQKLEYNVNVTAQLIPLFAVDARGNPVYDLKKEEMELLVNGKPKDILFFDGYKLDTANESAAKNKTKKTKVKIPERINFIILDSMISNIGTLDSSRAIAMQLVNQATPGDAFVILESNQVSGLIHVVGPEKGKKKIAASLKQIVKRFKRRNMEQPFLKHLAAGSLGSNSEKEAAALFGLAYNNGLREAEKYQQDVSRFAHSLKQLKFALKTTTLPKTVYLISAGPRSTEMSENAVTYLRLLEEAARAINYGGGVFYLINPLRQRRSGGGTELKFMSDAVGGRFISGTSIKDVAAQVKKSTSAYYETAFNSKTNDGEKNKILLTCKRKGVRLTSITFSEQGRPYKSMDAKERKLFVLNIISGGSWSRMVTPIKQIKYKTVADTTQSVGTELSKDIQLHVPKEIKNRKLHIYRVEIDTTNQQAGFRFSESVLPDNERMKINTPKGKRTFIVLIEPESPICYYSQVL